MAAPTAESVFRTRVGRSGPPTTRPERRLDAATSETSGAAQPRWARLSTSETPTTPERRRRRRSRRVERRRRLVAVAAVAMVAFVAGVLLALALMSAPAGGSLTDAAVEEQRRAERVTYVVEAGDTLWSVAGHLAPDEDPRVVVDELADARGTTTLLPGEVVAWPVD